MYGFDKGIIEGLVIAGVIIGSIVTALVFFVAPYVWGFIKPWLHAITA